MKFIHLLKHEEPPPPCGIEECVNWDKRRALERERERDRRIQELRLNVELVQQEYGERRRQPR